MVQKWSKNGPKWFWKFLKIVLKWSKIVQKDPKMVQKWYKRSKNGLKMVINCSLMAKNGPKWPRMVQKWSEMIKNWFKNHTKMVQKWSKFVQHWFKNGPKMVTNDPKIVRIGSKKGATSLLISSFIPLDFTRMDFDVYLQELPKLSVLYIQAPVYRYNIRNRVRHFATSWSKWLEWPGLLIYTIFRNILPFELGLYLV